ncbi:MAG: hypothetical protein ACLQBJ_15275 [Bryobacteraceae bacterium]
MHKTFLALSVFLAGLSAAAFAGPSQVKIVAKGAGYEFLLNGKPYFVKGAVGSAHLDELVAAGGNSIRAGVDFLDRAQASGLTVLAGLPFGKQRKGFDYSDAAAADRQRDQIRRIVLQYRDHPALLAWAIGNELELVTTPEQRVPLWKEVDHVAAMIHEIDPHHPVITPVGDAYRQMLHELNQYCPHLDAVGLNSYADMLSLPEDVAREGWTRPYLVTEFGPRGHWQVPRTPWHLPIEDTSTEKAQLYRQAYEHAVVGRPQCLGSYVFHWGQHHEKTHTWYGMFLEDGSRTEAVDVMSFLWSGKWPANRAPRIGAGRITVRTDDPETHDPAAFPPEALLHCRVDASAPDGDPLEIRWDLRRDVSGNPNTGGDREEPTPPVEGLVRSAAADSAVFQLPAAEGPYRLFVYVRDGHGNAATANYPLLVKARNYPPVPGEKDSARFGYGIQRTMTLLATSTPKHRHPVRVLFYGQSLTKQDWTREVTAYLRQQFPYADLVTANRAIGGYSTSYLIQTLPHDVYSFYPDLIIFHDFGAPNLYEQIIAEIFRHTTAEMLIQTDRPTWIHIDGVPDDPAKVKAEASSEHNSFEILPALANKYGCELVDLRRPYSEYLTENHLKATEILSDGAHFTLQGDYLVAELTKRHLRYDPALAAEQREGVVNSYEIGRDMQWTNGRLRLEFEGNRVDAIAGPGNAYHAAEAEVFIDGKRPSEMPELYFITRPSDTFAVDWPAVNKVTALSPLLLEDWTLRVTGVNADESQLRFEVTGSRTGMDGAGVSNERFVSRSGRVVIDPDVWGVRRAFDLVHKATPTGFEVKWRVAPMFLDVYVAPRIQDPSAEYATTLALGLTPGKHTLELVAKTGSAPPIGVIRVYNPPLK